MKSPVVKRSIVVAGHKTSVSLEEAFWNGMKEIASVKHLTLSELVGEIDGGRQQETCRQPFVCSFSTTSAHAPCRQSRARAAARLISKKRVSRLPQSREI